MRTRTTTATTLAAVLLLALTACSSSDDSPSADPTDQPPAATSSEQPADEAAELEDAVKDYTDAYFAGDADAAYGTLSKRCQDKVAPEAYSAVVGQAAAEYGPDHAATDVEAQVSGELARVSYKVSGLPKFDQQSQPWTLEGGAWKYDAC